MDSIAERQNALVCFPADVEEVGIQEMLLVTIARSEEKQKARSPR